jgi:hypothetical protein
MKICLIDATKKDKSNQITAKKAMKMIETDTNSVIFGI